MRRIRVMLVDDQAEVVARLRKTLDRDFDIVGTAESGEELVAIVAVVRPDVVVLNVSMPEMSGIDASEHVKKILPEVKIVMFRMHADEAYVEEALKAGASAYVLKASQISELVAAIQEVQSGGEYLSPSLTHPS